MSGGAEAGGFDPTNPKGSDPKSARAIEEVDVVWRDGERYDVTGTKITPLVDHHRQLRIGIGKEEGRCAGAFRPAHRHPQLGGLIFRDVQVLGPEPGHNRLA